MSNEAAKPWADGKNWKRIAFIILFGFISRVAEILLATIALIQSIFTLLTGSRNARLLRFGGQLSFYVYQIFQFMTYNIDKKPYPFSDWPEYKVSEKASAGAKAGAANNAKED